jgi:hypothetical protein
MIANALQWIDYWATLESRVPPKKGKCRYLEDYPVNGGALIFKNADDPDDPDEWILDKEAVLRGAEVMKRKYPTHWDNFITENDDAITADVYVQCCIFGEVIYG